MNTTRREAGRQEGRKEGRKDRGQESRGERNRRWKQERKQHHLFTCHVTLLLFQHNMVRIFPMPVRIKEETNLFAK